MSKIERPVVYTAIYGNIDNLKDPLHPSKKCDYVCFTDRRDFRSSIWDIQLCEPSDVDPTRSAKLFKMLPHNYFPHQVSLYIDGTILLQTPDIDKFIRENIRNNHFVIFGDPNLRSIDELVDHFKRNNKIFANAAQNQYETYRSEGFPPTHQMVKGGVLLRQPHREDVIGFEKDWWLEIQNHSISDEVSFPYVAWRRNFTYALFPDHSIYDCPAFEVQKHEHR